MSLEPKTKEIRETKTHMQERIVLEGHARRTNEQQSSKIIETGRR
jgi:hypothetical protein